MASEMKHNDILLDCYQQFENQSQSNNFQFDINLPQSFQGPIQINTSQNKGRCWIAAKQINPGDIILIEKAFVFSSRTQHAFNNLYHNSHSKKQVQESHLMYDLIFDETAILMAQLIETKIIPSHTNHNNLKHLYPRNNDILSMDAFDTNEFGIESDHDLWLFNHYLSKLAQHKHTNTFLKRLPFIVYYNAMVVTQNTEQLCYFKPINNKNHTSSYSDMTADAIYLKGSFFNHNCKPNLNRYFIGDILVVKAVKCIAAGEECTFSYLESEYLSESDVFRADRLPFICTCYHCIQQRDCETKTDDNDVDDADIQSDDESEDDDIQIFDDTFCAQLMCKEAMDRILIIDELMKSNDIRFVDEISGYSAKAMTLLELKQYKNAGDCWMKCVESIKKYLGEVQENMVPFYVQNILCKISELTTKSNINKMGNKIDDDDVIQIVKNNKQIMKLMKDIIEIHDICFGGGSILFLRRYWKEVTSSAYPQFSKNFELWNSIITEPNQQSMKLKI